MIEPNCLTEFQKEFVLSLFPEGSTIAKADWMQKKRPCPVVVDINVPGKADLKRVVLRRSQNQGGVERETSVLPALAQFGLPVPEILAGPTTDSVDGETVTVLSFLLGQPLRDYAVSGRKLPFHFKELAIESFGMLAKATDFMMSSSVANALPRRTLWDEWAEQNSLAGEWKSVPEYAESLQNVESACLTAMAQTPLVFSNGEYQPGNFLTDGEAITGVVDFEKACFADPLFDVARYPIYGIESLIGIGVAPSFCKLHRYSSSDFELRVIVFGLKALRIKSSPEGESDRRKQQFRDPVLYSIHMLSKRFNN